jgi:CRISPR/Cas system CSM-associated protein Csm3 (group 7 of RAMP superfamily)
MQFNGFFVSNDTGEALFQGFNVVSTTNIHGSTMRGILRSHAERIARTMTNLSVENENDFLLKCPAADPTSTYVEDNMTPMLESLSSRIYRLDTAQSIRENLASNPEQVLDYLDLADQLFGSSFQGSRFFVEDAHLMGKPQWKPLNFVAIDRFTGGAADQKKFDALALWQPQFKGRLFLESPQLWQLGWLWMLLRDWREGFITFGYGASKGFGQVLTVDFDIQFGWTHPDTTEFANYLSPLNPSPSLFWTISNVYQWNTLPIELKNICVTTWQEQVANFEVNRDVAHQLPDPYWSLTDLYL